MGGITTASATGAGGPGRAHGPSGPRRDCELAERPSPY